MEYIAQKPINTSCEAGGKFFNFAHEFGHKNSMQRRTFLFAGASLAATGCASVNTREGNAPANLPRRLRAGDTVALCATSGVVSESTIERAEINLEGALGLRIKRMPNLRKSWGGYAGTIAERVADLHAAFSDPAVAGIWCARGGSGAQALLPHLDYALIKQHPKILIGYSDVTALHNALLVRAGLMGFHGPVSSSQFSPYNVANLKNVLFEGGQNASAYPENFGAFIRVDQRRAIDAMQGTLIGGNLSVFVSMVGSAFFPNTDNAIVCLEDVGEAPYRIDRMLTQLTQARVFERCAGVLLGTFTKTEPKDNEPTLSVDDVFRHHFANAPFPVLANVPFGHMPTQWVLPIGARARVSLQNGALTFIEPVVR
jgi:muramoyltetrapeptide carboxypeptidase